MRDLYITNTLSRKKELFVPIHKDMVGLYVCGPTVYGDAHLGHARPGITYDVLVRLFRHLGYKVRYVRNITDVGHLEQDADEGEDKIAKKARLEKLEPMEVVQEYTLRYHEAMKALNTIPPSIEPRASGHIIEQIELVKKILDAGYAYQSNGSIYFDVEKYNKDHKYGILSGRDIEDMIGGTRDLDGQSDKKVSFDFALWKKASPEHIMRWPSPWSDGFPGWHLECSAMSEKYLGKEFDIHGGGMDLLFPHHECEIAQNTATRGNTGARYWIHNNMITIEGKKMGKSYNNFITLQELFEGTHPLLQQAYSPMTVRFFILQAHYRSTLDFSNEALQAAEKGLKRAMQAGRDLKEMAKNYNIDSVVTESILNEGQSACITADNQSINDLIEGIYSSLCDDLNTPVALAHIFEAVKLINTAKDKKLELSKNDICALVRLFDDILFGVMGLENEDETSLAGSGKTLDGLMKMVLSERQTAKSNKDWATSDRIRDELKAIGISIKDTKDGTEWNLD